MSITSEFLRFNCCRVLKTTFTNKGDVGEVDRFQKKLSVDFLQQGGLKAVLTGISYVKEIGETPMDRSFGGKITGEALEDDTVWVSIAPYAEYIPFDRKVHCLHPGQRATLYHPTNSMFYVCTGSGTIHGFSSLQEYSADIARKMQPNQRLIFTATEHTVLVHIWWRKANS